MKDTPRFRIRCRLVATLAAVGCLASAWQPSAAFAQTDYYWGGGPGTWDTTSNLWYPDVHRRHC